MYMNKYLLTLAAGLTLCAGQAFAQDAVEKTFPALATHGFVRIMKTIRVHPLPISSFVKMPSRMVKAMSPVMLLG